MAESNLRTTKWQKTNQNCPQWPSLWKMFHTWVVITIILMYTVFLISSNIPLTSSVSQCWATQCTINSGGRLTPVWSNTFILLVVDKPNKSIHLPLRSFPRTSPASVCFARRTALLHYCKTAIMPTPLLIFRLRFLPIFCCVLSWTLPSCHWSQRLTQLTFRWSHFSQLPVSWRS